MFLFPIRAPETFLSFRSEKKEKGVGRSEGGRREKKMPTSKAKDLMKEIYLGFSVLLFFCYIRYIIVMYKDRQKSQPVCFIL